MMINAMKLAEQIFSSGKIEDPEDWSEMKNEIDFELIIEKGFSRSDEEYIEAIETIKSHWYPNATFYITVRNEFHGSEALIPVKDNGHVAESDVTKAAKELCGMETCRCYPIPLNADQIVDVSGRLYMID